MKDIILKIKYLKKQNTQFFIIAILIINLIKQYQ